MATLPAHDADPAYTSFQFLEDLSTAYWFSEVLFTALELKIFDLLDEGSATTACLATLIGAGQAELSSLLRVLTQLELIVEVDGRWFNGQLATLYLISGKASYMGDFLIYRKYMQAGWQSLSARLLGQVREKKTRCQTEDDYAERTLHYVRATDQLMRQKAAEIAALINPLAWQGPVLDIGGAAGSLSRALLRVRNMAVSERTDTLSQVDLVDLPEVLAAARKLYTSHEEWLGFTLIETDFRLFASEKRYGLVVLSNFLHAYSEKEAEELLCKAAALLQDGGILLIHDYFPDRQPPSLAKGALYDMAMMLNTYNGRCHTSAVIRQWLGNSLLPDGQMHDLSTDSSVLVTVRGTAKAADIFLPGRNSTRQDWPYIARAEGFVRAVLLPVADIITGPWVRQKCSNGCSRFGANLQCPPHGMSHLQTRELLDSFSWALLVEGMPPGREFHQKLLALEKRAFLSGFHKAFVLGAGHCPVCDSCTTDGTCRFPDLARPSMEGSGIDVYSTAKRAAIPLQPVQEKTQYVKYLGLLLLD